LNTKNDAYYKKALRLHGECFVCDTHWDLAPEIFLRRQAGEKNVLKNRYLEDVKKGGFSLVVSSIFARTEMLPEKGLHEAFSQIAALACDIDSVADEVILIRTSGDLERVIRGEKTGVMLYMEGLDPLGNTKELLRAFYEAGVRGASLTWSRRNFFAEGCCRAHEHFDVRGGLSALGRETIPFMEKLGMFIDVSHLNDEGFAELCAIAEKPFIASHSCARSVHDNYRNLTDGQIQALSAKGGVIGINGYSAIAGANARDAGRWTKLAEHIEHIVGLSSYAHAGYGFDICTPYYEAETHTENTPTGDCVASHGDAIELTAELLRRGHGESDVRKIIGGNFAEYFKKMLRGEPLL
jgi:membrane dipeptidase